MNKYILTVYRKHTGKKVYHFNQLSAALRAVEVNRMGVAARQSLVRVHSS